VTETVLRGHVRQLGETDSSRHAFSDSDFTDGAVEKHSQPQTPLILMDGTDLFHILEGRVALDEVLERKRRHAAETGVVMYRVN